MKTNNTLPYKRRLLIWECLTRPYTLVFTLLLLVCGGLKSPAQTFQKHNLTTINGDYNGMVRTADLDQDGDQDIIASTAFQGLVWFENLDGKGQFNQGYVLHYNNVYNPRAITAVDINNDSLLDIVFVIPSLDIIYWLQNLGKGQFSNAQPLAENTLRPRNIIATDLDNDGFIDIVVNSSLYATIEWFKHEDGQGNFSEGVTLLDHSNNGRGYTLADLDNDTDLDLVVGSAGGSSLNWIPRLGDPVIYDTNNIYSFSNNTPSVSDVFAADINNDGHMDLITAAAGTNTIEVYKNHGNGTFRGSSIISTETIFVRKVRAVDIDLDNDLDIIAVSSTDDLLSWFENDGNGRFGPRQIIGEMLNSQTIYSSDIDGDGDQDIVSGSRENGEIAWYENQTILQTNTYIKPQITLLPNPTQDTVYIKANTPINHLALYNTTGTLLMDISTPTKVLSLKQYPPGIYFVTLEIDNHAYVKKLVKY